MTRPVYWNSDAQPYDGTLAHILYDIRRSDAWENLLMDAVTVQDIIEDSDGELSFDALVSPYARLERRMEILRGIMERTGDKVRPVAMQVTQPFKQRGVANVAAIFELSDGQTVSIYFHNPDTTPGKMAPTDEVISWKWLLNKKDITIVVAPERGADLNVREVARRIMRLAEKNSVAFTRANAKRAERMQTIADLKTEITQLAGELKSAQNELEVVTLEWEEARERAKAQAAQPEAPLSNASAENSDFTIGTVSFQFFQDKNFFGKTVGAIRVLENGKEMNPAKGASNWPDGNTKADIIAYLTRHHASAIQKRGEVEGENAWRSIFDLAPIAGQPAGKEQSEHTAQAIAGKAKNDAQPDLNYRRSADGLFTTFFPNTPAGEEAWRTMTETEGGERGKVLAIHTKDVIKQLRDAGYTVREDTTPPISQKKADAMLAELTAAQEPQEFTAPAKPYDEYLNEAGGNKFEAAKAFYKTELQGKIVKTVIGDVHLLGSSWQEMRRGMKSDPLKTALLPRVPEILKAGKYEGRAEDNKGRGDEYVAFHYFLKDCVVEEKTVTATVSVGERSNKKFEYTAYGLRHSDDSVWQKRMASGSAGQEPASDAIESPTNTPSLTGEGSFAADSAYQLLRTPESLTGREDCDLDAASGEIEAQMLHAVNNEDDDGWNIRILKVIDLKTGERLRELEDGDWDGEQKTWLVTAYPDDRGEWSGGSKTIGTAAATPDLVQGNPSQVNPHGDDSAKTAATTLFQSVIDGNVPDILAPELADEMEAAYLPVQGDPEIEALFERAVDAYQAAMLAATENLE